MTISDMIPIRVPEGYSIYIYNNSRFNSPVHVYPDDPYEDDAAYLLLPNGIEPPDSETGIYDCVHYYGGYFGTFR